MKALTNKHSGIFLALLASVFFGCERRDYLLKGRNFQEGGWLLVKETAGGHTEVIDDETVLQENPEGLFVKESGDCRATTCEGFLYLYKDGELLAEQEFLKEDGLYESSAIQVAYIRAVPQVLAKPGDTRYDSLKKELKRQNSYPYRLLIPQRGIVAYYYE